MNVFIVSTISSIIYLEKTRLLLTPIYMSMSWSLGKTTYSVVELSDVTTDMSRLDQVSVRRLYSNPSSRL